MPEDHQELQFEIFPWNSNFMVGIDFIDTQHQKLVELLNKVIWQFVTFSNSEANDRVLNQLVAYARYHFHEEELLWRKHFGDTGPAADHYKSHANFFTKIQEIQSTVTENGPRTDKLIEYLTNWLAVHILHSDRRMAAMVQEIEQNDTTIPEAERIAKETLNQTPLLQSSIVELYNKLSQSAAQLIRERNARLAAETQLQEVMKVKAEQDLEVQALEYQKHLEFLAYNEPLTGLLNRNGLVKQLKQMMQQTTVDAEPIAAIAVDLDYFSQIGSQLGSDGTNRILGILARRWQDAVMPHGSLAHLGGDDFVVLVKNSKLLTSQLDSFYLAANQTFHIDQWQSSLSFTAGVSLYSPNSWEGQIDPDRLLRQADYALYQAKQECRGHYLYFDAHEDQQRRLRNDKISALRNALLENQFVLHYQPKVDMRSGTIIGVEALIRWQHPEQGLLAPADFLPALEKHPLIIDLGEWVINQAIQQMIAWDELGLTLKVSVNVDALQVQHRHFPMKLKQILEDYPHFDPQRLDLEILETVAINEIDTAIKNIKQCRNFGVSFSLDDFGKGYCSLSYLKQLPVDTLKIDQAFVRNMLDDATNVSILEGIIAIARTFNLKVIAEGVESVMHGEFLIQIGCELAQGFSIARPMPARDIPQWIQSWKTYNQWTQSHALRRDDILALTGLAELNAWQKKVSEPERALALSDTDKAFYSKHLEQWMQVSIGERPASDIDTVQQIERIYRKLLKLGNKLTTTSQEDTASFHESSDALQRLTEQIRVGLKECLKQRNQHQNRR